MELSPLLAQTKNPQCTLTADNGDASKNMSW